MKFGPLPLDQTEGGVVAHTVRHGGFVLKKGAIVGPDDIAALRDAGFTDLIVATLEAGDLGEDAAALRVAHAVAGENLRVDHPFTGRANLFALKSGVLVVDVAGIDSINAVDERVTVATLPAYRTVVAGEMVATIKIIPFAVPGDLVARAITDAGHALVSLAPFQPLRVGVISTLLPGLKPSTVDKTLRVLDTRLAPAGATIVEEVRIPHEADRLTRSLREMVSQVDLLIVFGASAITDRRDVIPAALETAGGTIEQLGMPVDPGNLLLVGMLEGKSVLGAPGCARSPKENGFDWILHRRLAGLPVLAADVRRLGVGGLLMEIVSRGQPRGGEEPTDEG